MIRRCSYRSAVDNSVLTVEGFAGGAGDPWSSASSRDGSTHSLLDSSENKHTAENAGGNGFKKYGVSPQRSPVVVRAKQTNMAKRRGHKSLSHIPGLITTNSPFRKISSQQHSPGSLSPDRVGNDGSSPNRSRRKSNLGHTLFNKISKWHISTFSKSSNKYHSPPITPEAKSDTHDYSSFAFSDELVQDIEADLPSTCSAIFSSELISRSQHKPRSSPRKTPQQRRHKKTSLAEFRTNPKHSDLPPKELPRSKSAGSAKDIPAHAQFLKYRIPTPRSPADDEVSMCIPRLHKTSS